MDLTFLYQRIKYLIIDPEKAWTAIFNENLPIRYVRNSFFLPLIILVSLAAFTGTLIFKNPGLTFMYAVLNAVKYFLLLLFAVHASSIVLRELTYALDLGRDFTTAFKLISYSLAPYFICQAISRIFESFIFVNVLALYGLFIFWIGMEKMLNPPEHKKMPLMIITAVAVTGLIIALNFFLTMFTDKIYFAFFTS